MRKLFYVRCVSGVRGVVDRDDLFPVFIFEDRYVICFKSKGIEKYPLFFSRTYKTPEIIVKQINERLSPKFILEKECGNRTMNVNCICGKPIELTEDDFYKVVYGLIELSEICKHNS